MSKLGEQAAGGKTDSKYILIYLNGVVLSLRPIARLLNLKG